MSKLEKTNYLTDKETTITNLTRDICNLTK